MDDVYRSYQIQRPQRTVGKWKLKESDLLVRPAVNDDNDDATIDQVIIFCTQNKLYYFASPRIRV